jgi:hypothetical protein
VDSYSAGKDSFAGSRIYTFGLHKMRGVSKLAERLSASQ